MVVQAHHQGYRPETHHYYSRLLIVSALLLLHVLSSNCEDAAL